jgi:hypothetical protein
MRVQPPELMLRATHNNRRQRANRQASRWIMLPAPWASISRLVGVVRFKGSSFINGLYAEQGFERGHNGDGEGPV